MSESSPLRVALIGYGYAGRALHAPLLRAVPGLTLTVLGSSRPEAEIHATLPDVQVIADPLAAVQNAAVDLVVIATPNAQHTPLAEAALAAGKHVVVDKPFTLSLTEARLLAETAARTGRLLSVFQNRRFDSDFLTVSEMLAAGRLGRLVEFESRIDRYRPEVPDRWRERPEPGGGLWFDLGPHLVDQALKLFGLPQTIAVTTAAQRRGDTAPDWFHAVLAYAGLHVILGASCLAAGGRSRFILHGTEASLVKQGVDVQESQLRQGMAPGDLDWGIDLDAATLIDGASAEPEVIAAADGDWRRYYAGVRDAILGRGPNPVTPAEAVAVMAAIEAGVHSAETGRALPLALTESERAAFAAAQRG
ncbi:oxidoreductase [Acidisoma sp. 7E03]